MIIWFRSSFHYFFSLSSFLSGLLHRPRVPDVLLSYSISSVLAALPDGEPFCAAGPRLLRHRSSLQSPRRPLLDRRWWHGGLAVAVAGEGGGGGLGYAVVLIVVPAPWVGLLYQGLELHASSDDEESLRSWLIVPHRSSAGFSSRNRKQEVGVEFFILVKPHVYNSIPEEWDIFLHSRCVLRVRETFQSEE